MLRKCMNIYFVNEGVMHLKYMMVDFSLGLPASFPGSCSGEEEREPGTHCLCMCEVPLVTCILLRYTKIMVNFCSPAERPHCKVILPVRHVLVVLVFIMFT